MTETLLYDNFKYYLKKLDSTEPAEKSEVNLDTQSPAARILLTLLHGGPQTMAELMEQSELIVSQFQAAYDEMIKEKLVSGPQWTDKVELTPDGDRLARLQERVRL